MSYPEQTIANPYATPTENSLEMPLYGASFRVAIQRFFKKYATFSGRASRSEYWWVALFSSVVSIVAQTLATVGGLSTADPATGAPGMGAMAGTAIAVLFGLATLIPSIAISIRRLHDANFSGWMYLLILAPILGALVIIVLMLLPTNPAGARFDKTQALATA